MGKKTTAKIQTKKKRWVEIHATGPYQGNVIGETYIVSPEEKLGQKITVSLSAVTGETNRQNLQLKFIINNLQEGRLYASLIGAYMLETTLKKLVRKNKDKIDLSFLVKTSDKQPVRIKILATTRNKTTGVVITKLIKRMLSKVTKTASEQTFDQFMRSIIARNLQKDIQTYVKKTYPVAVCEVRSFELLTPNDLPQATAQAEVQITSVNNENNSNSSDEEDAEEIVS